VLNALVFSLLFSLAILANGACYENTANSGFMLRNWIRYHWLKACGLRNGL